MVVQLVTNEHSGLTKTSDRGDGLMADKGINVQDVFAPVDFTVTVNIPRGGGGLVVTGVSCHNRDSPAPLRGIPS